MDNPEVLIAIFGVLGAIAAGILTFFTARADRRSKDAEKNVEKAYEALVAEKDRSLQREKLTTEATQKLIDNLTRELERQASARETADKTHSAQITRFENLVTDLTTKVGGLESENEALRQQVTMMENTYEEEAKRWVIDRQELVDALAVAERCYREAQAEIGLLRKRILSLEKARDDGNALKVAEEPLPE